jgi:hypothetical protein
VLASRQSIPTTAAFLPTRLCIWVRLGTIVIDENGTIPHSYLLARPFYRTKHEVCFRVSILALLSFMYQYSFPLQIQ